MLIIKRKRKKKEDQKRGRGRNVGYQDPLHSFVRAILVYTDYPSDNDIKSFIRRLALPLP